MQALTKAADNVGSWAQLARRLDISKQRLNNWKTRQHIPVKFIPAIAKHAQVSMNEVLLELNQIRMKAAKKRIRNL